MTLDGGAQEQRDLIFTPLLTFYVRMSTQKVRNGKFTADELVSEASCSDSLTRFFHDILGRDKDVIRFDAPSMPPQWRSKASRYVLRGDLGVGCFGRQRLEASQK